MIKRSDKRGQVLRMGDRVRLPSNEEGEVVRFGRNGGRQRAVVRYTSPELDEVTLPCHLLERLSYEARRPAREANRASRDRLRRGHRRGEDHYRARLSDHDVREMRELHHRARKGYETLALIFGCGTSTARDICTGRTRRDA